MFFDRVAPPVFVAVFVIACGDSNLGTPGNSSLGDVDAGGGSGSGTNNALASGQCPPVGSTICPNDNAATQADVDNCNADLNDPNCGSEYKTYLECAGKNVTCDSTGQSDSTAIQSACGDEVRSFATCTSLNTTDGG
jgi:hypothetical protein